VQATEVERQLAIEEHPHIVIAGEGRALAALELEPVATLAREGEVVPGAGGVQGFFPLAHPAGAVEREEARAQGGRELRLQPSPTPSLPSSHASSRSASPSLQTVSSQVEGGEGSATTQRTGTHSGARRAPHVQSREV
jgi:hypothetical protein